MRAKILQGGAASLVIRIFYIACELGLTVLLARALGASGFGEYTFVIALVKLLTIPTAAGLPELIVRQTAYYSQRRESGFLRGLFIAANVFIALASALMVASVLVVLKILGADAYSTLLWGLCLIPILALGFVRGAMLRGFRRVVLGQLPEGVLRPALFLCFVASGWFFLGVELDPGSAMATHVAAASIAFLVGYALFWKVRPEGAWQAPVKLDVRGWGRALVPFSLIAGIQVFNSQIALVILNVAATNADVATYKIAIQFSLVAAFPLTALGTALSPHFAHAQSAGDMRRLRQLARRSSQLTLGFGVAAVVALVVAGRLLIELLFGAEYRGAFLPMLVLLVGQLASSCNGSLFPLLKMVGREAVFTKFAGATALLNCGMVLVLVPMLGVTGAAAAAATAMVLLNVALASFSIRKLRINPAPVRLSQWRRRFYS